MSGGFGPPLSFLHPLRKAKAMTQNPAPAINARFFIHTSPNPIKSKEAGRPIFDEMECVEISHPGDKYTKKVFPAHEVWKWDTDPETGYREPITHAMRFPELYKAFKNNEAQEMSGTPLSELPFLSQSKRLEYKALGVHTAEQLAALDGQNLKQLGMGGREHKNQAQAYLDKAAETADVTKQAAEIAALKARLEQYERAEKTSTLSPSVAASPFADMDKDGIKEWIADATGSRPQGNPSHETLVRMADEINADLKAKKEAEKQAA